MQKMLHCCIYDRMYTFNYLKSSLNVQNLVPDDQIWLFFPQIAYLFQNKHSHLAAAAYPFVDMPSKPELIADQRKQIVSHLLVKEDNLLPIQLKWGALISTASIL
jgi:hypothetical protein